jgi:hypothetical protein
VKIVSKSRRLSSRLSFGTSERIVNGEENQTIYESAGESCDLTFETRVENKWVVSQCARSLVFSRNRDTIIYRLELEFSDKEETTHMWPQGRKTTFANGLFLLPGVDFGMGWILEPTCPTLL